MINILVADDHIVVRQGIKKIIHSSTTDIEIADEANNGQEVIEKLWKKKYNVIVMGISMSGRNGLEVTQQVKSEYPDIPVLILSMYPEEQYAVRAIKAGASGYLNKKSSPEDLIAAIRKVVDGRRYIPPSIGEELARDLQNGSDQAPHEQLSNREYQVLCKIALGQTVSEIADELALSVKTISTYRTRILRKIKMRNNAQLTRYAIENDLAL